MLTNFIRTICIISIFCHIGTVFATFSHDPVMVKEGSVYYVFYTGGLINKLTSTNMSTWAYGNSGLSKASWWTDSVPGNSGSDLWAPDISYRSGKWWLYYAVSVMNYNTSAIGLATSTTLSNASWTDQGCVIKSKSGTNNYNCIDPSAFTDTTGKTWLVFGSFWNGIQLVELDSSTGKPALSYTVTQIANHKSGIEGAALIRFNGHYYLFVSWDLCCKGTSSTYKIAYGRASQVEGPYYNKAGVAMTTGAGELLDTGDSERIGPGGQSVFIENDTAVYLVNHYYASGTGSATLQIRRIYFGDGWVSFTPTTSVKTSASNFQLKTVSHSRIFYSSRSELAGIKKSASAQQSIMVFSVSGKNLTAEFINNKEKTGKVPEGVYISVIR